MIWRNSGVSNMYTFLYRYLERVKFFDTRRCVHFTKKRIEEYFCVSVEEEEDSEVLPVSDLPLLVE